MKQRILSITLSLALLLCAVSATGITMTSAAGGYTDEAVTTDTIIAPEDNYINTDANFSFATSTEMVGNRSGVNYLYDGGVQGVNTTTGSQWFTWENIGGDKALYIMYDFGVSKPVNTILVAGFGPASTFKNLLLPAFDVYVTNDTEAVLSGTATATVSAPAATAQGASTHLFTLAEPVTGRYLVLKTMPYSGGANFWLSELAASSTKQAVAYTVTDITASANTDKVITTQDNILKTASGSTTSTKALISQLYDGVYACLDSAATLWYPFGSSDKTALKHYITYDLGEDYAISSLLLAGSSSNALSGGCGVYGMDIYVGDKTGTEIREDATVATPVYSTTDSIIDARRVDLTEAAIGRYVVFVVGGYPNGTANKTQIWVSEIAATGAPVKPPKAKSSSIVCIGDSITWGHYFPNGGGGEQLPNTYPEQLEALLDNSSADTDYTVYNYGNSGKMVVSGSLLDANDGGQSWYETTWNSAKAAITTADAALIMLGTNDASNNGKESWNGAAGNRRDFYKQEYRKLVAAIQEANPDIQVYVLTSPASLRSPYYQNLTTDVVPMQLELAAELGLPVVDIFNITRDLMRDEGEAAFIDSHEIKSSRVHPHEEGAGVIAQACFDALTNPTAHVSTLSSSATADTDGGLTFAGVNGGVAANTVPDANRVTTVGHNLLNAAGTKVTGYQAQDPAYVLADGNIRFVNTTEQNHNTAATVTIDFGVSSTISQILLGGCQLEADNNQFLYPGASVYVTDDLDNKGDAVWSVESADTDGNVAGRVITLAKPVTGRYMVVELVKKTVWGTTSAWISEIAAVGHRAAVDALGGQVRKSDNALRFGFAMIANDVAYADNNPVENNNYARDLTNAAITVGGKNYTLVDFGAVLSLDADSDLTLDAAAADTTGITKAVPAKNLYELNGQKVTYTAVVTGIPDTAYDTPIYARPYVTYTDGTTEYTVYGSPIFRTVNGSIAEEIG